MSLTTCTRSNRRLRATARGMLPASVLVTTVFVAATAQASLIASWTFETTQPAGTAANIGPLAAEIGTGSATGHHASATTVYSSPAGNGSAHSFSSNMW